MVDRISQLQGALAETFAYVQRVVASDISGVDAEKFCLVKLRVEGSATKSRQSQIAILKDKGLESTVVSQSGLSKSARPK
jgi:hypothetical protein